MHTYTHMHTHAYANIHTHTHTHTRTHARTHTCITHAQIPFDDHSSHPEENIKNKNQ